MGVQSGCAASESEAWELTESGEARRSTDYVRPAKLVAISYLGAIGAWAAAPKDVSKFNDSIGLNNFYGGFQKAPHVDEDHWVVNYVFHPLVGSETHVMARNHGWGFWEAAGFDLLASVAWEYGPENFFEHPSVTDLVVTGPVGAILGELRYQAKQILAKSDSSLVRRFARLLDPLEPLYRQGRAATPDSAWRVRLGAQELGLGWVASF